MAIIVDITTASSIFWKERYENQTKPQKHRKASAGKPQSEEHLSQPISSPAWMQGKCMRGDAKPLLISSNYFEIHVFLLATKFLGLTLGLLSKFTFSRLKVA